MRLAWPHNPLEVGFSYIGSSKVIFMVENLFFVLSVSIISVLIESLKRGQVYDLCFG